VVTYPPVLPPNFPNFPQCNLLRPLNFTDDLGGWEDFSHSTARSHLRRARVRVYAFILPYSQREKGIKGFKGFVSAVVREGGLLAGRIA
jgi:hypothetical protein